MSTEPTYTASEWRKKFEEAFADMPHTYANILEPRLDKLCPKPKKMRLIVEVPEVDHDPGFWHRCIGLPFAGGVDSRIVAIREVAE